MKHIPKVTVIIPTYNRSQFLERSVKSVLSQTFTDFELLIVNNGNEENKIKAIVEKFAASDARVRYFYIPKPDATAARNLGIAEAKGEYIAFLDDDDEWFSFKLETQLRVFEENKNLGLVSCPVEAVDSSMTPVNDMRASWKGKITVEDLMTQGCIIYSLSCAVIRRECFEKLGVFDGRYVIANDYHLYLRIAQNYSVISIQEKALRYHYHSGNMTSNTIKTYDENISILKTLKFRDPQLIQLKKEVIEKRSKLFCNLGSDAQERREYKLAIKYFAAALARNPFIGMRIQWGRYDNVFYRFFRPYLALIQCCLRQFSIANRIEAVGMQ